MPIINVDPEKIQDNPYQPRSYYPPAKIAEVAESIEQNGLIHIPHAKSASKQPESRGSVIKLRFKKNNTHYFTLRR